MLKMQTWLPLPRVEPQGAKAQADGRAMARHYRKTQ